MKKGINSLSFDNEERIQTNQNIKKAQQGDIDTFDYPESELARHVLLGHYNFSIGFAIFSPQIYAIKTLNGIINHSPPSFWLPNESCPDYKTTRLYARMILTFIQKEIPNQNFYLNVLQRFLQPWSNNLFQTLTLLDGEPIPKEQHKEIIKSLSFLYNNHRGLSQALLLSIDKMLDKIEPNILYSKLGFDIFGLKYHLSDKFIQIFPINQLTLETIPSFLNYLCLFSSQPDKEMLTKIFQTLISSTEPYPQASAFFGSKYATLVNAIIIKKKHFIDYIAQPSQRYILQNDIPDFLKYSSNLRQFQPYILLSLYETISEDTDNLEKSIKQVISYFKQSSNINSKDHKDSKSHKDSKMHKDSKSHKDSKIHKEKDQKDSKSHRDSESQSSNTSEMPIEEDITPEIKHYFKRILNDPKLFQWLKFLTGSRVDKSHFDQVSIPKFILDNNSFSLLSISHFPKGYFISLLDEYIDQDFSFLAGYCALSSTLNFISKNSETLDISESLSYITSRNQDKTFLNNLLNDLFSLIFLEKNDTFINDIDAAHTILLQVSSFLNDSTYFTAANHKLLYGKINSRTSLKDCLISPIDIVIEMMKTHDYNLALQLTINFPKFQKIIWMTEAMETGQIDPFLMKDHLFALEKFFSLQEFILRPEDMYQYPGKIECTLFQKRFEFMKQDQSNLSPIDYLKASQFLDPQNHLRSFPFYSSYCSYLDAFNSLPGSQNLKFQGNSESLALSIAQILNNLNINEWGDDLSKLLSPTGIELILHITSTVDVSSSFFTLISKISPPTALAILYAKGLAHRFDNESLENLQEILSQEELNKSVSESKKQSLQFNLNGRDICLTYKNDDNKNNRKTADIFGRFLIKEFYTKNIDVFSITDFDELQEIIESRAISEKEFDYMLNLAYQSRPHPKDFIDSLYYVNDKQWIEITKTYFSSHNANFFSSIYLLSSLKSFEYLIRSDCLNLSPSTVIPFLLKKREKEAYNVLQYYYNDLQLFNMKNECNNIFHICFPSHLPDFFNKPSKKDFNKSSPHFHNVHDSSLQNNNNNNLTNINLTNINLANNKTNKNKDNFRNSFDMINTDEDLMNINYEQNKQIFMYIFGHMKIINDEEYCAQRSDFITKLFYYAPDIYNNVFPTEKIIRKEIKNDAIDQVKELFRLHESIYLQNHTTKAYITFLRNIIKSKIILQDEEICKALIDDGNIAIHSIQVKGHRLELDATYHLQFMSKLLYRLKGLLEGPFDNLNNTYDNYQILSFNNTVLKQKIQNFAHQVELLGLFCQCGFKTRYNYDYVFSDLTNAKIGEFVTVCMKYDHFDLAINICHAWNIETNHFYIQRAILSNRLGFFDYAFSNILCVSLPILPQHLIMIEESLTFPVIFDLLDNDVDKEQKRSKPDIISSTRRQLREQEAYANTDLEFPKSPK